MSQTDHDLCIQVLEKYVSETPQLKLIEKHYGGEQGPNFLAEDTEKGCLIYVEVELDAKKAERHAKKALELFRKHQKPVYVWVVASSEKWAYSRDKTGIGDYIQKLKKDEEVYFMGRISPSP